MLFYEFNIVHNVVNKTDFFPQKSYEYIFLFVGGAWDVCDQMLLKS